MGFRVLKGGMLTTVQDLGRTGYQSQGFSVSGVMDVRSFKIANLLLDNPENEAVLEFTLMGPSLEFTSETIIAITGGDFHPRLHRPYLLPPLSGCLPIWQAYCRELLRQVSAVRSYFLFSFLQSGFLPVLTTKSEAA